MKRYLVLLVICISLLLSACSEDNTNRIPSNQFSGSSSDENSLLEKTVVYTPSQPLTMEETIEQFFEQQYNAYADLQYIDISYLLDMNQVRLRNSLIWLETLIQRRSLIEEHQLAFVETAKYPYKITYDNEPRDQRMEFWTRRGLINEDEVIVHFTITGEKGQAYPPLMAVNSQHTMRLNEIDGVWKITFHYFPGATRRFHQNNSLILPSEEEMLADLMEEFRASPDNSSARTPLQSNTSTYDGVRAAQYAKKYSESRNPAFYDIEDWLGNCANFISQSLLAGLGTGELTDIQRENMTSQWYAGEGGGSPAWENVEYFWEYATESQGIQDQGLHGEVVETISELELGGIVQVRTGKTGRNDENFNHSLILVDSSTLLLAQNSPDCFVYYSDLVNVDARFFNPRGLNK
ncbi:MAG: hypothetical protein APF84_00060 [Gracilibacter sp. BRH_c7a]|nr:MAG: hypothetical protein APF84_00060 [Gracilibacter sp. BRH_c7a]